MSQQPNLALAAKEEPVSMTGGILNVIARAAADPNTDVDKLARLLEMQERVLAREAEQAFNDALRTAQEEIRPVVKNRSNPETKSKYADLEAVSDAIDPVLHRNGFSLSFGSADCPLPGHYRVTCDVSHKGGHTRGYQLDVPIDDTGPKGARNKTATHGFGSALSYGRRYLKLLIADVATKDDDGRAAGRGSTVTQKQADDLRALAEEVGADKTRFLNYLRENGCRHDGSFETIPASDYAAVVKALEAKREK